MTELNLKSRVCFGADALSVLSELKHLGVTILTDPFFKSSGKTELLEKKMPLCNISVYTDIVPDPAIEQVADCYRFVKAHGSKVLIAFGGGSAIDTAKAVVLTAEKVEGPGALRLIAIPTTSGTGSEVTNFTVIKDNANGAKYPLVDDCMLPELAILDYTLTMSVPPAITADTGMDVITHAFEAYASKKATLVSDALAEKALTLAFSNLLETYLHGDSAQARENMQMASYLAGLSFTQAGLGITHSIAHAIGAQFHIPHGRANAMILPHVIAFNAYLDVTFGADKSETAKRYAAIAQKIGLERAGVRLSVQYLIREINALLQKMQIPKTLLQAGVKREDYKEQRSKIIDLVLADVCTETNPRQPGAGDIGRILDAVFDGSGVL